MVKRPFWAVPFPCFLPLLRIDWLVKFVAQIEYTIPTLLTRLFV